MIADALSTFVGGGGLAGIATGAATLIAKLYEKRLDQEHARALWAHEAAMHRLDADHERWMGEQELLIATERVAGETMVAAIESDGREAQAIMHLDGMPWGVGAVRTLTRPALTAALILLVALIWWTTTDHEIRALIVSSVLGLSSAAVSYWFGGRVVRTTRD